MTVEKAQDAHKKKLVFVNAESELRTMKLQAIAINHFNNGNLFDALSTANEALKINSLSFKDFPLLVPKGNKVIICQDCDTTSLENLGVKFEAVDREPSMLIVTDSQFEKLFPLCATDSSKGKVATTTTLHCASRYGFLAVVKNLISSGSEPEEIDGFEMTALMWAKKYDHREIVNYLVEKVSTPSMLLKMNVHTLISAGKFDEASYIIENSLKVNPLVFGSRKISLINKQAMSGQILEVPVPVISFREELSDSAKRNWALYYKLLAIKNIEQQKLLMGLRLIEEALSYDADLNFSDLNIAIPSGFQVLHRKLAKEVEDWFRDNLSDNITYDNIYNNSINALFNKGEDFLIIKSSPDLEIFISDLMGFADAHSSTRSVGSLYKDEQSIPSAFRLFIILASLGYRRTLHLFLSNNTSAELQTSFFNQTLLSCAARFGQIEILSYLVKVRGMHLNFGEGALNESPYFDAVTPLQLACENNDLETAKVLVDLGALVQPDSSNLLTLAIRHSEGRQAFVKFFCDKGAKVAFEQLVFAVDKGYIEIAKILVKHVLKEVRGEGLTLCMKSCFSDVAYVSEVIRLLFNPDAVANSNYEKCTLPLCEASRLGHIESVKFLLDRGAAVNAENNWEQRALVLASREDHCEVVKVLLDRGASVNAVSSCTGRTALSVASENGRIMAAKILLQNGADVDSVESNNGVKCWTPLMFAAMAGELEMVKLLVKHHASINKKDLSGQTAIMLAQKAGKDWIVDCLLSYQVDVHAVDPDGVTNLMVACASGNLDSVRRIVEEFHAELHIVDSRGRTAFHHACLAGSSEIIEYLLEKGVDVNHADHMGRTGLMLALQGENSHRVLPCLIPKSDLSRADKYGRTALMYALPPECFPEEFNRRYEECVEAMLKILKAGADVNIIDQEGYTTLEQVLHQYSYHYYFGYHGERPENEGVSARAFSTFEQMLTEYFGITQIAGHQLLRDRINEVQSFLRPVVEEYLAKQVFINYLKEKKCIDAHLTLEGISKNLDLYSIDHSILLAFVDFDLRDKLTERGWAHIRTIQALSRLKGIALHCWEESCGKLHISEHTYVIPTGQSTRRDILLRGTYRFEQLFNAGFRIDAPPTEASPEYPLNNLHITESVSTNFVKVFSTAVVNILVDAGASIRPEKRLEFDSRTLQMVDEIQQEYERKKRNKISAAQLGSLSLINTSNPEFNVSMTSQQDLITSADILKNEGQAVKK